MKQCNNPQGCECIEFSKKFCKWFSVSKKSPVVRLKRTRINPRSPRLVQDMKAYNILKELWLPGKICVMTGRPAEQVHHIRGRQGKLLTDVRYWLPVTQEAHTWIHQFPEEARAKGWLQ